MQLHARRSGVATLSLLLLGLLQLEWGALAIEAECSACEAVAAELQRRLDAEHKRAHLDMRHRLDKDGNRYGKILDYKVSEQRAVNLLDDLCSTMDDYTMIAREDSSSTAAAAAAADTGATENSSTDPTAESGKEKMKKSKKKSKKAGTAKKATAAASGPAEMMWVKHQGDGKVNVPKLKRPNAAEEELRQKQLQTFCGMMLELYEDEVLEALTTDAFSTRGTAPVLCQHISSKCKGKQYPQLQLAASAADASSSAAAAQTEL